MKRAAAFWALMVLGIVLESWAVAQLIQPALPKAEDVEGV